MRIEFCNVACGKLVPARRGNHLYRDTIALLRKHVKRSGSHPAVNQKLIGRAKKTILLIDSWVGPGTLDMLAKKRKGVVVEVVTSPRGNKLAASDITKFNAQYGGLSVKTSMAFHDHFLIIDDKELYLIGASLKDLGKKCFGFTSLDKSNIPDILAKI